MRMERKIEKVDKRIFEAFRKILEEYTIKDSEDNLNDLLEVYQALVPNWVNDFNRLSNDLTARTGTKSKIFQDFLKLQLPRGYNIQNLKAPKNEKHDLLVDIMQRGRIIHLSNKIAHQFDYIFETQLRIYMAQNGISTYTPEEFYEVKRLIRQVYSERTRPQIKERAIATLLQQYHFEKEDFVQGKNLDVLDFRELIQAYNDGMYIKDEEIESVDRLAHNYDKQEVSYGIKRIDNSNTLFVMDVQGFGQFSVHMKDPSLIAQIKRKYKMPLYRTETAILVDHMSDTARDFIEEAQADDSMDEERRIPQFVSERKKRRIRLKEEIKYLDLTPAEKHELGVKSGLIRRDLEDIDRDSEEGR